MSGLASGTGSLGRWRASYSRLDKFGGWSTRSLKRFKVSYRKSEQVESEWQEFGTGWRWVTGCQNRRTGGGWVIGSCNRWKVVLQTVKTGGGWVRVISNRWRVDDRTLQYVEVPLEGAIICLLQLIFSKKNIFRFFKAIVSKSTRHIIVWIFCC